MGETIEELKRKLANAEAEEQKKAGVDQAKLNKFCIGKCFKNIASFNYSTTIRYKLVHDYIRYTDGKIMYGDASPTLVSEDLHISYSRAGYILQSGSLRHMDSRGRVHLPVKKHFTKGVIIDPSATHSFSYFRPEKLNGDKDVYSEHNWWVECTIEEFHEVREKALAVNDTIAHEFSKYRSKKLNYKGLIQIGVSDKKLLEELLNKVDNDKLRLQDYIRIAKQTAEFFQFSNNQLSELGQYSLTGTKGMNLDILGGDDGTDYEPYTTRYDLCHVNIDWKMVLYSIRTKLDSVVKTAEELENTLVIYNIDSWNVSYSGTYDVNFDGCVLNSTVLEQVNRVIKKHLI